MSGVNWAAIDAEKHARNLRSEMRKPIGERYKAKAASKTSFNSQSPSTQIRPLGNGSFERKAIPCHE